MSQVYGAVKVAQRCANVGPGLLQLFFFDFSSITKIILQVSSGYWEAVFCLEMRGDLAESVKLTGGLYFSVGPRSDYQVCQFTLRAGQYDFLSHRGCFIRFA